MPPPSNFDSFNESGLGGFSQSALGCRGGEKEEEEEDFQTWVSYRSQPITTVETNVIVGGVFHYDVRYFHPLTFYLEADGLIYQLPMNTTFINQQRFLAGASVPCQFSGTNVYFIGRLSTSSNTAHYPTTSCANPWNYADGLGIFPMTTYPWQQPHFARDNGNGEMYFYHVQIGSFILVPCGSGFAPQDVIPYDLIDQHITENSLTYQLIGGSHSFSFTNPLSGTQSVCSFTMRKTRMLFSQYSVVTPAFPKC